MGDQLFRGRVALALLSAIGVFVLLQLVAAGGGDPDGRSAPPGSSYSTNGDGVKAFRQLLEVNDYDVSITRVGFAESTPDPATTVVVIGGEPLPQPDGEALRDFVVAGGRLVVAAQPLETLLGIDLDTAPAGTGSLGPSIPYPTISSIERISVPDETVYAEAGPLLAIIGPIDSPAVGTVDVEAGSIWAIADASILSNDALDMADNAALALILAGPPTRPVIVAEYNHGYEPITGLASIPGRWRVALWMSAIAGVVWMVSRGRRLGPPAEQSRPLPPPRSAYVSAMAINLARTKELVGATAPVRERIRRELRRRGGDDPANVVRVANQLDLDPARLDRAMQPPGGPDDALDAGRVLSKLSTRQQ